MPIPWYYIWTPKYELFHKVLSFGIHNYPELVENKNIFMTQEDFNQYLNKAPGHYLCGCSIKLKKTYELLCTLPEGSYFIFSDADILLFPERGLEDLLSLYINQQADIVFMRESGNLKFNNVGFSLIRVCNANRELFKTALGRFEQEPGGLDGSFINEAIKSYKGRNYMFPVEFAATSSTLIEFQQNQHNVGLIVQSIVVFQAFVNPEHGVDNGIEQKLVQYKMLGVQFG
jgi:hypothetical protein